jgi:parvulin-like peptidyl-prolyl isomerase
MSKRWITPVIAGLAIVLAGCHDDTSNESLVARAGDHRLTVDQVVSLLQDQESVPTQAAVVRSLADLWIDYTLLAEAVAKDSTFPDLDLGALVKDQTDQEMVFALRDSMIHVDTIISRDELKQLYEAQAPDVKIHARHIMLTVPFQATQAQRDSVRAELEGLRVRIMAGERFEDIARAFSQDPGSAAAGGDLGHFGKGDMVKPFEDAVLALKPGQVSDVVETPMGLHLIKLEDLQVQDFDQAAAAFRTRVVQQRTEAAESTFVAGLEGRSPPHVTDGALDVAKELARDPGTSLSSGAARRALVEWDGGAYTAGELQESLQFEQAPFRQQLQQSPDPQVEGYLLDLARRKLLVDEARASGLQPPQARVDSLIADARGQLLAAAHRLGLTDLNRAPGEPLQTAIARAVRSALSDNLTGATAIVPLGPVGFQLRKGVPISVYDNGIGQALLRIAQVRAARGPSAAEASPDTSSQAADTVSR